MYFKVYSKKILGFNGNKERKEMHKESVKLLYTFSNNKLQ